MKQDYIKGTQIYIVNEDGSYTGCSCDLDKPQALEVGEVFLWQEGTSSQTKFRVVTVTSMCVECVDITGCEGE